MNSVCRVVVTPEIGDIAEIEEIVCNVAYCIKSYVTCLDMRNVCRGVY